MLKAPYVRTTFGSCDVEKVHAVVARSTFRSQNVKSTRGSDRFAWHAQGIVHLVKSEQNVEDFVAFPKTMAGGPGTFEEDLQRSIFRGRRSTRDMFIRAVRRSGADFLRGVAFWSIKSSGLLRWFCVNRCSTSYDLASFFRGRRSSLDKWTGKIAKRIGARPSALHATFHFWRKSQNCFVFDVVNFKNWGRLAELLRFQACR